MSHCFYGSLRILGVTLFLFKGEFCLQITFQHPSSGFSYGLMESKQWFLFFLYSSDWRISQAIPQCGGSHTVTRLPFVQTGVIRRVALHDLGLIKFMPGTATQLKPWAEHASLCPGTTRALMQSTSQQQFPVQAWPESEVPNCPVTVYHTHIYLPCF